MATERSVAFVDLAGFTALTDHHGDETAVELVDHFVRLAVSLLPEGARLVKTLGDAVMLAFSEPVAAVGSVSGLMDRCFSEHGFPLARGGIHHGAVVERPDDVLGAAMNVAARVAAEASGGQLLVTEPVARAVADTGLVLLDLGPWSLRNVSEPIRLFEVPTASGSEDASIDPVCRIRSELEDIGSGFRPLCPRSRAGGHRPSTKRVG